MNTFYSSVFNIEELDDDHAAQFNPAKPWVHDFGEFGQLSFEAESEACADQQAYRKRHRRDPMTGEQT